MTAYPVTSAPDLPKQTSLKPADPTQILNLNAAKAFKRLNRLQSAPIQKVKDATIKWIREVFELPDAVLIPGRRGSQMDCPIARALRAAGLQGVRVLRTRVRYNDLAGSGRTIRVMFPAKIRRFVAYYDAGLIPELQSDEG